MSIVGDLARRARRFITDSPEDGKQYVRKDGCRVGKGVHSGTVQTQAMIRRLHKSGRPVYALKTDFSKYFYSIDREVLWRRILAKISCRHTLWLIEQFTPRTGRGLPIGNLTSQLWANVYGTAVDRFIAQTLRISNFVRYMDDVVVLHNSRAVLETVHDFLECLGATALSAPSAALEN